MAKLSDMDIKHPLEAWIGKHSNQAKVAEDAGISEPYLSEILSGKKTPSLKVASRLSKATGGKVPLSAFAQSEAAE